MKRLFAVSALILSVAIVLNSCSGGGGSSGFLPTTPSGGTGGTGTVVHSTTTTISGTVQLSSTVSTKPSSGATYKAAATGSTMDQVLTAAGVKQAVSMPPLVNATMKLYNADRPDWNYPVSQVFTDSTGLYKFDVLMNADLNGNAYTNGDPIPSGNYTVIATNDTTVSGGKQLVAVQSLVKRFEGDITGNNLVVQDSDALPSVMFMFGQKPNSDGSFGTYGTTTVTLAPNAGIQIVFNMAMARLSVVNAVKLYAASDLTTPLPGTWKFTPDLQTATFYPTGGLNPSTDYTVKVAGGFTNTNAAVNVYGKPLLANLSADFTSEASPDTTPPQNLILYKPSQTNVPVTTPIQIASPEPLDINSIRVTGTPSIGDKPMVLFIGTKPITIITTADYYIYEIGHIPFKLSTNYSITISNVVDMAGNQISPLSFVFKTESATNGVTPTAGATQDSQLAVKDVFGKWVNAMETRNAALLTTYMTGGFYWVPDGWSPDDLNRDGRLNLNEFRSMLEKMFSDFDHCETMVTGDADSSYLINLFDTTQPTIKFQLNFQHNLSTAATDQICINLGSGTGVMKADMEYINSAWLISKGADDSSSTGYPSLLEVVELRTPGNGITFPEPTPTKPLMPDFVWDAVAGSDLSTTGIKTYAIIITDATSSNTGWVGLIDGAAMSQGDQMTFTYAPNPGCINPSDGTLPCVQYVMGSGSAFGFANNITELKPGGKYYWSVIGFKTATIAEFDANAVTNPASDLGASSQPFDFTVANNVGPSVILKVPDNGTIKVSRNLTSVTAVFSEAMNESTIISPATNFYLTISDSQTSCSYVNPVSGTVSYDAATRTATLTLAGALEYNTTYKACVTTGVSDSANNAMGQDESWFFTTVEAPDLTAPTTTANPPTKSTKMKPLPVTLSADDTTAKIYYTTDNTTPDIDADGVPAGTTRQYQSAIIIGAEGTTYLKFFGVDPAGNKEGVNSEEYTIDTLAPTTTATVESGNGICNTADYCKSASIAVTLTADDAAATIYYTTDDSIPDLDDSGTPVGTTAVYSGAVTLGGSDGTYKLKYFAMDNAESPVGNKEAVKSKTYVIDTAMPDTSITGKPDLMTKNPSANFTFISTEQNSTFLCEVRDAVTTNVLYAQSACTSPFSYTTATEMRYEFRVWAKDAADNIDTAPATYTWTFDTIPPSGSITINGTAASGNSAYTQTSNTSLTIAVSETNTTVPNIKMQLSKDGTYWSDPATCSNISGCSGSATPLTVSSWNYPDVEGVLTAHVRFIDEAGNVSTAYSASITYDKTAPETTIGTRPEVNSLGKTASQSATFSFEATEQVSKFECSLDGVSFTDCTLLNPITYSLLGETSHTFDVRAVDKAGNTDTSPANFAWTVDLHVLTTMANVAPAPSVAGKYNSDVSVTLTTTGMDPSCGSVVLKYCIDNAGACDPTAAAPINGSGASAPTTTFSLSIPASTQQIKTIRFYSQETGGGTCNEDEYLSNGSNPKIISFDIDKVLPNMILDSGPTAGSFTSSTSATFSFHADETATEYDCSLNGGSTWEVCHSPWTYNGLGDAARTFAVRAKDMANNYGPWTTRAWTVDTTPPNGNSIGTTGNYGVTINSGATYSQSGSVTLTVNATDTNNIASIDVSNDNFASWSTTNITTPYPATINTTLGTSLAAGDGYRYIYVRFRDAAGNVSTAYSDSIYVDTVNPDTYFNPVPAANTSSPNNSFYFTATEGASSYSCYYTYRLVSDVQAGNDNYYRNSGWYNCSSPQYLNNWLDGTYTFYVYATDYAGRSDSTVASHTWTIFSGYWDSGRWDYSKWGN